VQASGGRGDCAAAVPLIEPAGAVTASLLLALHALNEVRAASAYLKLCQVRADFGTIVQTIATAHRNAVGHARSVHAVAGYSTLLAAHSFLP